MAAGGVRRALLARDPEGPYARARAGEAPELPGAGVACEPPPAPQVVAAGGEDGRAVEAAPAAIAACDA